MWFSHKMYYFTKLRRAPFRVWILKGCETVCLILSPCCLSANITRISRLFTDAKKILLYSQNDKSYEGYRGLLRALRKLQKNTARKDIPFDLFCVILRFWMTSWLICSPTRSHWSPIHPKKHSHTPAGMTQLEFIHSLLLKLLSFNYKYYVHENILFLKKSKKYFLSWYWILMIIFGSFFENKYCSLFCLLVRTTSTIQLLEMVVSQSEGSLFLFYSCLICLNIPRHYF